MREVLWFFDPGLSDPFAVDGRCLVRYSDGRVKQSVLPPADARLGYAMGAHGVKVRGWGGVGCCQPARQQGEFACASLLPCMHCLVEVLGGHVSTLPPSTSTHTHPFPLLHSVPP